VLTQFPRGSEWRRWDLHIHTPFSTLNNGFGQDFDAYARDLFRKAVAASIAVIGVTDYFSIDGYRKLRELRKDKSKFAKVVGDDIADRALQITLLPNIEFRSSVIVRDANGSDSRVNFHLLLSDEIEPKDIEEHLLRQLFFSAQAAPGNRDERWSLTSTNFAELGAKLKKTQKEFKGHPDLYVGLMNAVVDHGDLTAVLTQQTSRFRGRYLFACPVDEDLSKVSWSGQGHLSRKLFIQKSDLLFSSNEATRAFALRRKHPTIEEFRDEFGAPKACVHGSDAHKSDDLFQPTMKRYCWIKADPTFRGLQQLVHEPETRVYIGETPPAIERVIANATKYIREISFSRTLDAEPLEKWFNGEVPLNAGLVAIIGNKGSGKSALSDIAALLGNTHLWRHFSFLNPDRFLSPRGRFGDMFLATMTWAHNGQRQSLLSAKTDATSSEAVKYIPQNYLEEICTEVRDVGETRFDMELMEVIFSHVDDAQRLGASTLADLVHFVNAERQKRIDLIQRDLAETNRSLEALEGEATSEFRMALEGRLESRKQELEALMKAKPLEVVEPTLDPEVQQRVKVVQEELKILQSRVGTLEAAVDRERSAIAAELRIIAAADRLLTRVENLSYAMETFFRESETDAATLKVDIRRIASVTVDSGAIRILREQAATRHKAATKKVENTGPESLIAQKASVEAQIAGKRGQLDEPSLCYQEYLTKLAEWEEHRKVIVGSDADPASVLGLQGQIARLDTLPGRIAVAKREREALCSKIWEVKKQLLAEYRRLYGPVQSFIDTHPVAKQQGALAFEASIHVDGFKPGFLEKVHQGRRGRFQGEDEGATHVDTLLGAADFTTTEGAVSFANRVVAELAEDEDGKSIAVSARIREQLRQNYAPRDVYDFVFGLSYLRPRFELRWQGKPIDKLSPGERGNLLLVFYLLIDKRDTPLIIDQPEENLDNHTIYTTLVPAIRYAKELRQIVIVTHNPNLAVVCDAEQVIYASIDKSDGNKVTYTSGAIEEPIIAKFIVDVLEGTKPAFDLRDARYEIVDRLTG
jgi:hypothetical protein